MIADQLKPLAMPIADLAPDPANARKHSQRNLDTIAASLRQFGQRKPVVVQRTAGGLIVRAGNGTLAAARSLGWEEIAAVVVEEDNASAAAFAIADNRSAELAEWDDDVLGDVLRSLGDFDGLDAVGFDTAEIEAMLGAFDIGGIVPPELKDGDRYPYQQITFTLHDDQAAIVKAALDKAKKDGHGKSALNENSNGNALAWIAGVACNG